MTNTRKALATVVLLLLALATPAFAQFYRIARVPAYDSHTWRVWAPAGFTAVTVDGDNDTDLDCWVYDRFGTLVGSDTDGTDLCIIGFNHRSSGTLEIVIRNLGDVYNEYELNVD
jgi:hypothetical protein